MGTHLGVFSKSFPLMITNMTGFKWFSKRCCVLEDSSLSIGRVNFKVIFKSIINSIETLELSMNGLTVMAARRTWRVEGLTVLEAGVTIGAVCGALSGMRNVQPLEGFCTHGVLGWGWWWVSAAVGTDRVVLVGQWCHQLFCFIM